MAATGTLAAATSYGIAFGQAPYLDQRGRRDTGIRAGLARQRRESRAGRHRDGRAGAGDQDQAAIRRDIKQATADLNAANLQRRIAREQLADARDAEDQNAVRQALLQVYAAQNEASKANEERESLRSTLQAATVRSPIDGIVKEVNVTEGFDAPAGRRSSSHRAR